MKVIVLGVSSAAVAFAFLLGVIVIGATGSAPPASAATPACVTKGPLAGLSTDAATNARTVVAVSERQVGSAGAVIAVMVGYAESGLRVLGNSSVSLNPIPIQGLGSDHDSVGIFQQRANWGTVAQRMDPQLSTGLFVSRLVTVPHWQTDDPWIAGQDVQRSAYDGTPRPANHESSVVGGNYKAALPLAQRVVATVDKDAAKLDCGQLTGGLPANTAPGSHGLPASYVIPADATPSEAKVVAFAIAQLDKPYVFGAAGPTAYDCSGLTLAAWAQAGVTLVHDTVVQAREGTPTAAADLVPGDLVLVPGDDGTLAAPGHVGMYIGLGLVLNAADEQIGIRVQTYDNFIAVGHGLSALRHIE